MWHPSAFYTLFGGWHRHFGCLTRFAASQLLRLLGHEKLCIIFKYRFQRRYLTRTTPMERLGTSGPYTVSYSPKHRSFARPRYPRTGTSVCLSIIAPEGVLRADKCCYRIQQKRSAAALCRRTLSHLLSPPFHSHPAVAHVFIEFDKLPC